MLSKCANPACTATFHFLHEGIVFRVLRPSNHPRPPTSEAFGENTNLQEVERYWLCDRCSRVMTLAAEGDTITVRSLPGRLEVALSHRPEFERLLPFPP